MPVIDDLSGSRSGFNCAIGVLDGTTVGVAMVGDGSHTARRGRVMRLDLFLHWAITLIAIEEEV